MAIWRVSVVWEEVTSFCKAVAFVDTSDNVDFAVTVLSEGFFPANASRFTSAKSLLACATNSAWVLGSGGGGGSSPKGKGGAGIPCNL